MLGLYFVPSRLLEQEPQVGSPDGHIKKSENERDIETGEVASGGDHTVGIGVCTLRDSVDEELGWVGVVLDLSYPVRPGTGRDQPQQGEYTRYHKISYGYHIKLPVFLVKEDVEDDGGQGVEERHDADKHVKFGGRSIVTV